MWESGSERRNVVFLVLDSLRKDRVSPYNEDIDFTENLEEIADSSVVFEDAITQAPWTLPSHASIFTGEYPWNHGTTHARSYFPSDESTFVSEFSEAGYTTAAITPNVWITPHKGMTRDFEYVENFLGKADSRLSVTLSRLGTKAYHSLDDVTRRVLGRQIDRLFRLFDVDDSCKSEETIREVERYIDRRSPDEDFFLYVNLMEPHEPYRPPQKYKKRHGVDEDANIPHRQKDVFTEEIDFDALRSVYDASVEYTDDLVGRIVESLRRNDLDDDTVVFVLSDHGQALGDGGGFGHQFTVSESVINTVLMVDHPDLPSGREDRTFELRNLSRLVPHYAGIAPHPDGVFSDVAKGGLEFPENFTGYIPKDRWNEYYRKYRYAKSDSEKVVKSVGEDGETRYEAYDLETGEEIRVPSDLADELKGTDIDVDVSEDSESDGDEPETDEAVERRLESLGYN
ncbi:MAG: sulfatase-like hydrolase/transferase [Halobacteria archaeon]|nr:sulfatase-like hydrolase/transferase [Halobacteria archaeon]